MLIKKINKFFSFDLWKLSSDDVPEWFAVLIKILRVMTLVFKGFVEDDCFLHASALTLTTLLAIMPMLALSMAVVKGFTDTNKTKIYVKEMVAKWTDRMRMADDMTVNKTSEMEPSAGAVAAELDRIVDNIFSKIESLNFKAIGGMGLFFLLLMVVQVLSQVEYTFNRIWGVKQGRKLIHKFTAYIGVMCLLPILITLATSIPIVNLMEKISSRQQIIVESFSVVEFVKLILIYAITVLTFTFIIKFMPNTHVKIFPAFLGGVIACVLFVGWFKVCTLLQVSTTVRYGKLYGSFTLLPLMVLWMYISWSIVLLSAEASFAIQNYNTYALEQAALSASIDTKIKLALIITVQCAIAMKEGRPFKISELTKKLKVSVRLINEVISILLEAKIIGKLDLEEHSYVLIKHPHNVSVKDIFKAILDYGKTVNDLGLYISEKILNVDYTSSTTIADLAESTF